MSEPTSPSDPTPEIPPAPSYTYDGPAAAPAQPPAPLPPPAYGERLPAPTGAPSSGAPPVAPLGTAPAPVGTAPARRRTWDVVLTVILFVLGFLGMAFGSLTAASLGDPAFVQAFEAALEAQGFSGDIEFGSFGTIVLVSHVLLYLVALGGGILLLVKNKVAFWLPLAAGVVAAIIFWGGYFVAVFSSIDITQFGR